MLVKMLNEHLECEDGSLLLRDLFVGNLADSVIAGPDEKHWEAMLQKVLTHAIVVEQYPRTCVQVVLQVCREGGSELAALLNAAVAALIDAGVSMHAMYASASVALTQSGSLLVDPDSKEQEVRLVQNLDMLGLWPFRHEHASQCLRALYCTRNRFQRVILYGHGIWSEFAGGYELADCNVLLPKKQACGSA